MSTLQQHIALLAQYNSWMNAKLYDAAATLTAAELALNRGAFFGSIIATLNHIVVADTFWLKRFAQHPPKLSNLEALEVVRQLPAPAALNDQLFTDLVGLHQRRIQLDEAVCALATALTADDLDSLLNYTNTAGVTQSKSMGGVLLHFFNHQTHHRGQTTTLLTQAGVDVGVTDLHALIPSVE